MKNIKPIKIYFLFTLAVMLQINNINAQNLVPNPSFEECSSCPDDCNQTYLANGWQINIHTANYFNKCVENDNCSIPINSFGYQYPTDTSCQAYMGFFARGFTDEGKEGIGCELVNPLIVGQKYFVSFKVCLADVYVCGLNKVGVIFTKHYYGNFMEFPNPLINNYAHVYTEEIINDTLDWTTITGSFVADSSYKYMIIGHFFDDNNTSFICFDSSPSGMSYYYLDDICVSTDSLFCANFNYSCGSVYSNGIINQQINVYANNSENYFDIVINEQAVAKKATIELYNALGRLVLNKPLTSTSTVINTEYLKPGVYFVKIYIGDNLFVRKLFIN